VGQWLFVVWVGGFCRGAWVMSMARGQPCGGFFGCNCISRGKRRLSDRNIFVLKRLSIEH
jgi:hypothetical protein